MSQCRFPFTDCPGCDQCARPVYTLPPAQEPLRTKLAMLAFTGAAIAILSLVAFSGALDRMHDVNRAYQEEGQ